MAMTRRRFFQGAALGIAALPLLKTYASSHQSFRDGMAVVTRWRTGRFSGVVS